MADEGRLGVGEVEVKRRLGQEGGPDLERLRQVGVEARGEVMILWTRRERSWRDDGKGAVLVWVEERAGNEAIPWVTGNRVLPDRERERDVRTHPGRVSGRRLGAM